MSTCYYAQKSPRSLPPTNNQASHYFGRWLYNIIQLSGFWEKERDPSLPPAFLANAERGRRAGGPNDSELNTHRSRQRNEGVPRVSLFVGWRTWSVCLSIRVLEICTAIMIVVSTATSKVQDDSGWDLPWHMWWPPNTVIFLSFYCAKGRSPFPSSVSAQCHVLPSSCAFMCSSYYYTWNAHIISLGRART